MPITQICSSFLFGNLCQSLSDYSSSFRMAPPSKLAHFNEFPVVSLKDKEEEHSLLDCRLGTVWIRYSFRVRLGVVLSMVWLGSEYGFFILFDENASDNYDQNSIRTTPEYVRECPCTVSCMFQVVKVPSLSLGNPIEKVTASKGESPLTGNLFVQVQFGVVLNTLEGLSEYGSVACLVERPTQKTHAEQYSDTILI